MTSEEIRKLADRIDDGVEGDALNQAAALLRTELEKLLNSEDERQVEVLPDGSVREIGAPTPSGPAADDERDPVRRLSEMAERFAPVRCNYCGVAPHVDCYPECPRNMMAEVLRRLLEAEEQLHRAKKWLDYQDRSINGVDWLQLHSVLNVKRAKGAKDDD